MFLSSFGQWALGVIMYEFLYGCPPFNDETPEKVFDNIISRRIYWPEDDDDVSSVARDLMEKLMCTDPARRLGAQGAQEIKMHPFFADVDWSTVPTAEATFIPQVTDLTSTDYFDSRGLVELPEEFEAAVAAPETSVPLGSSPHKEKTDDFGAFDFRNLSASKAANDQVVQSMSSSFPSLASGILSVVELTLNPHF
jgi:serine/threonine-protein kinase RIM15